MQTQLTDSNSSECEKKNHVGAIMEKFPKNPIQNPSFGKVKAGSGAGSQTQQIQCDRDCLPTKTNQQTV